MGIISGIWAVWSLLVVLFFGLKVYSSRLSRDEDDQLILDDVFDRLKAEQAEIVAKVRQVEPIQRAVLWVLGVASLFVVGYYVMDIINQFKV